MPNKRLVKWFTTLWAQQALAANNQITFDLLDDLSVTQTQGATIQRMLIDIWLRNDTIQGEKAFDWGIVLVSGEAQAAGVFPDPDVEDERVDWLGRGRMSVYTNALFVQPPHSYMHRDLRAQRMFRNEFQQLRLICNLDVVAGGGVLNHFTKRLFGTN